MNKLTFRQQIQKLSEQFNLNLEVSLEIVKKVLIQLLIEDFPNMHLIVEIEDNLTIYYQVKEELLLIKNTLISNKTRGKMFRVIESALKDEANLTTYEKFKDSEGQFFSCKIAYISDEKIVLTVNGFRGILPLTEQIPNESFKKLDTIWCYLRKVDQESSDLLTFSRKGNHFVKLLLNQIVPDIRNNTIQILSVARKHGVMCKVLVDSTLKNTIGSCLGTQRCYYDEILSNLGGEKVRFVENNPNLKELVANALSYPQYIEDIYIKNDIAYVNGGDYVHLLIGKGGYNIYLASRLCLNIKKIEILKPDEFKELIIQNQKEQIEQFLNGFEKYTQDADILKETKDFIEQNNSIPQLNGEIYVSDQLKHTLKLYYEHKEQVKIEEYIEIYGRNDIYELLHDLSIDIVYLIHQRGIENIDELKRFENIQDLAHGLKIDHNMAFLIFERLSSFGK